MDKNDIIFRLQLMTLFDATSYGLLYAFISPYLITLGGDQVTIGIFTVTTLIFQLMSIHIVMDLVHYQGQRAALYTILNISAICHALLFLTSSTCFVIMARCVFSSTNQSTNIIKNCLIRNLPQDRRDYHMNVNYIMNCAGFIIGPALTGVLFDLSFAISCFLASILTILNIWILTTIPGIDNYYSECSSVPAVKRVRQSVERRINEIKHSCHCQNWDVLSIQYFFSTSVLIFSTKYSPVLKNNYKSDHTEIGWVTSYMNIVVYASIYFSERFKERMEEFPPILIMNGMMSVLLTSLILCLYAPALSLYCLMCIPVTFSRTMILNSWDKFVSERNNSELGKASDTFNIIAGLTIPMAFGFVANQIGHHSVIIFSVCPIILSLLIINHFTALRGQDVAVSCTESNCSDIRNCPNISSNSTDNQEEICDENTCLRWKKMQ